MVWHSVCVSLLWVLDEKRSSGGNQTYVLDGMPNGSIVFVLVFANEILVGPRGFVQETLQPVHVNGGCHLAWYVGLPKRRDKNRR